LTAFEKFAEDKVVEVLTVMPNKKKLGEVFKREAKPIQEALDSLGEEDAACLQSDLEAGMLPYLRRLSYMSAVRNPRAALSLVFVCVLPAQPM
jgi:hypothetical protein